MTWEEHEKVYCPIIEKLHEECDIYDGPFDSYSSARNFIDCYEQGYDEGNIASLKAIKYNDKYWAVFLASKVKENYYDLERRKS